MFAARMGIFAKFLLPQKFQPGHAISKKLLYSHKQKIMCWKERQRKWTVINCQFVELVSGFFIANRVKNSIKCLLIRKCGLWFGFHVRLCGVVVEATVYQ
jgi:hypothetical protein